MENLLDKYLEQLKTDPNKGLIITKFYMELFDQPFDKNIIIQFNRLIKLYGWERVFYSLLDMYDMPELEFKTIFRLITYFCKKRLERRIDFLYDPLDEKIAELEKRINKIKGQRIKINDPF